MKQLIYNTLKQSKKFFIWLLKKSPESTDQKQKMRKSVKSVKEELIDSKRKQTNEKQDLSNNKSEEKIGKIIIVVKIINK